MSTATALMSRIRDVLTQRNMSQSTFARKIDVSPQTLSAWLSGRNAPKVDAIVRICQVLNVSPSWLLTGREDSPHHQSLVAEDAVYIPLFDATASCGNGAEIRSSVIVDLLKVNRAWVSRFCGAASERSLNLIGITGDSMEPTLHDGDFVVVDVSAQRAFTDALFAFVLDGDLFVKRFQRAGHNLVIHSDNPRYPPITLTPADMEHGFKVIGKVVTTCKLNAV